MAGLPFTVSLFLDGAVTWLQRRPPLAMLGLVVQRHEGALGVATWSAGHAAKRARSPSVLISLT